MASIFTLPIRHIMAETFERKEKEKKKRQKAHWLGIRAEIIAMIWLRLKGYRLLARRFRAGSGEIDLVAQRGSVVAFIEVKARRSADEALLAITLNKQQRIINAARFWITASRPPLSQPTYRFDAITIAGGIWPSHITNIFEAPELL